MILLREKGNEGINIETRVQNAFERETQGIYDQIAKIATSFNADMNFFEKHAGTLVLLLKHGILITNIKNKKNLKKLKKK
ncbi:hypothetical protein HpHA119_06940 [Helicobacter pylori]